MVASGGNSLLFGSGTTLVCERRAESGDLKSGEHIGNKNSKIVRLKLGVSLKNPRIYLKYSRICQ